jgi:hypothetical protein
MVFERQMHRHVWRDLFNRAASAQGNAIKQIARHHQPKRGCIILSKTINGEILAS